MKGKEEFVVSNLTLTFIYEAWIFNSISISLI